LEFSVFGEAEVAMRSFTSLTLLVTFFPILALAQPSKRALPEQAKAILEKATTLELYSLEPDEEEKPADKPTRHFGWKVLGKTTLKRSDEAGKDLLAAWDKAIGKGRGAKCFEPRHAIHAEHEGKKLDLLICFECGWVYVHLDEKKEAVAHLLVDRSVQPMFDKLLRDAKIPLAKKQGSSPEGKAEPAAAPDRPRG
jgi:hypothetical protein